MSGGCAAGQALRSVNADGTVVCADALTTIDGAGGGHASIAIGTDGLPVIGVDGLPIVSHQASSIGALRITHCINAACTGGGRSVTLDDPASSVGSFSSIAIGTNGLPVISHRESPTGGLRVAKCGTRTCQ